RSLLDTPIRIAREITVSKLLRTGKRIAVKIERVYLRAEPPRRERKQTAARTDVEKRFSLKRIHFEHFAQTIFCFSDSFLVQHDEKSTPVLAKFEAFTARDLTRVLFRDFQIFDHRCMHFLGFRGLL